MKRHLDSVHQDVRPFACHFCGHMSKSQPELSTHIAAVHEKRKPFKCEICSKGFFNNQQMKRHQDVHDNVRPHGCHICEKKFKREHHLANHLKTIHSSST